jgi:hypothetical protein
VANETTSHHSHIRNNQNNSHTFVVQNSKMKTIGKLIWGFSEYFNIPLGKFAPTVFGWMIGRKGKKL